MYKYLALIAWQNGAAEKAEEFIQKSCMMIADNSSNAGLVVRMICNVGKLEYAKLKDDEDMANDSIAEILNLTKIYKSNIYENLIKCGTRDEKYEYLRDHVLTYMYH